MIRIVTSTTVWSDAVGQRMSITYSEVDEQTGKIISDNKRFDRIITDSAAKSLASDLMTYAQGIVDNLDG